MGWVLSAEMAGNLGSPFSGNGPRFEKQYMGEVWSDSSYGFICI